MESFRGILGAEYLKFVYGFDIKSSKYLASGRDSEVYSQGDRVIKLYNQEVALDNLRAYVHTTNKAASILDGKDVDLFDANLRLTWRVNKYDDVGVGIFNGEKRNFTVAKRINGVNLGLIYRDMESSITILPKSFIDFWTDQNKRWNLMASCFRLSKRLNPELHCSGIRIADVNVMPVFLGRQGNKDNVELVITDLVDRLKYFGKR